MSAFYKILKADPLGEPYTPNFEGAKAIQTFWCQVEGVDKNVSIGKQVGNTLTPGEYVYGDLMYAKSQKGTEFWKFKSAKVPEGVQRPAGSPAQATTSSADKFVGDYIPGWFVPFGNILIDLQKDMKLLKGDEPLGEAPVQEEPAKGVEQLGGEPLTPEEEQVLNGIFTPETPEDLPDDTPGDK